MRKASSLQKHQFGHISCEMTQSVLALADTEWSCRTSNFTVRSQSTKLVFRGLISHFLLDLKPSAALEQKQGFVWINQKMNCIPEICRIYTVIVIKAEGEENFNQELLYSMFVYRDYPTVSSGKCHHILQAAKCWWFIPQLYANSDTTQS